MSALSDHRLRAVLGEAADILLKAPSHRNRKRARVAARRETGERFIYVMSAGPSRVKVGVAVDVRRRRKQLQTGCPDKIEVAFKALCPPSAALGIEARCHRSLERYRIAGEWFAVEPDYAIEAVTRAMAAHS